MKTFSTLFIFLLLTNSLFALNQDSLALKRLESKFEQLENETKEIRRDELNYKIEKDLLKETYNNNYERINLMITVVLGIIGVLGFLGIRDIIPIINEFPVYLTYAC